MIEQVEEDIESQVSCYISKIVVLSTGKPWTPESGTLITVNRLAWRCLPEQERIWWNRLVVSSESNPTGRRPRGVA